MDGLDVELEYLEQLATKQEDAAASMQGAIDGAEGLSYEIGLKGAVVTGLKTVKGILPGTTGGLWIDHGAVCFLSIIALGNALDDRKTASENMHIVSTGLADRLREAAGAYLVSDDQISDNLDNQMLAP